jgi:putative transposase
MIEPDSQHISVRRQCQLLNISRSSLYYEPKAERDENLDLMRLLDEQYTRAPFYGIRRMTAWLRSQGKASITSE